MDLFQNQGIDPKDARSGSEGSVPSGQLSIQPPMSPGSLNAFSELSPPGQGQVVMLPEPQQEQEPLPIWLQRTFLIIYVLFCIEVGMLLTVLPWNHVWTDNALIAGFPTIRAIASNNFVRGMITGIGMLDIWIGIWEAVHYRDQQK